ncbi:MAG: type II/IV secretion system protein [Planctomycetes bacterium]|nr:type II/IV secretion system protein [Planctomycetota bacterium]
MQQNVVEQRSELLGKILKDMDLVGESQIQEALAIQKERGGALGEILVERNYIDRDALTRALAIQAGMEVAELIDREIPPEIVEMIPASMAQVYRVVPVRFKDGVLTVALADPTQLKTLDDLRFMLDCEIAGAIASQSDIDVTIQKYYSEQDDMSDILKELQDADGEMADVMPEERSQSIDLESVEEMASSSPVRKLLNLILLTAIQDRASDIHFEPFEDEFKVRYRVDGVLYEMVPPPKHLHLALTSRIKVMTGTMDIAERRLPQDGRIELNIASNPVDLRVSSLPTMFGESVVLRVLDRRMVALDINELGLRREDMDSVTQLMRRSHGIILCTGPTGCGKTTTLYAVIKELNDVGVKILTVEDPVEYDIEGVMQMPVREEIGVTFSTTMRHFLRQDPDIILVGEIRDRETGQMAIQASLTGHLVFSTVHTNDACTAITRLIDLGLEPYLINATLEGVLAQRLVRRICANCKEEYEPTPEALLSLGLRPEDVKGKRFYRGRGCDRCNNIGYFGRMGLFEILTIYDELRDMMLQGASTQELRSASRRLGCRSLRQSGLLAIYDGLTTIEEVSRVTLAE